jgi:peptidoglycan/LPS O-acetylase OafA/YrhL
MSHPFGNSRIPELDGLRGLAVGMVLVWHFLPCQLSADGGLISSILRRGLYLAGSGVDLFFVLSGFLIFGILLDNAGSPNLLRVFYLRRACRILPLYFLVLGVYAVLSRMPVFPAAANEWMFGDALPLWSYALFVQNIVMGAEGTFGPGFLSVTWSLAVEEQFYLAAPLVAVFAGRRGLAILLPLLLVAGPVLRGLSPDFHAYVNTPWRMDPLVAGGCLALLVRNGGFAIWLETMRKPFLAGFSALLAVVPLMVLFPGVIGVFDITWLALLYTAATAIAVTSVCPILKFPLRLDALTWLGRHSYAIYMFHQGVAGLLHGLLRGQAPQIRGGLDALVTLLALGVTLTLAWLSMRFYEEPILRLGRRPSFQLSSITTTA